MANGQHKHYTSEEYNALIKEAVKLKIPIDELTEQKGMKRVPRQVYDKWELAWFIANNMELISTLHAAVTKCKKQIDVLDETAVKDVLHKWSSREKNGRGKVD